MEKVDWTKVHFFVPSEFDSPDLPGSHQYISADLVYKLDELRRLCNFPLRIHSGVRTEKRNAALENSVEKSAHVPILVYNDDGSIVRPHRPCFAVDVGAYTSRERYVIVFNAISLGFKRIGVGKNFIHLDIDESKPKEVLWLYP